jgi:hypothetical protein
MLVMHPGGWWNLRPGDTTCAIVLDCEGASSDRIQQIAVLFRG